MKKTLESMRNSLVTSCEVEKVLEQSSVISTKQTEKESSIASYIFNELIATKKIGLGYQFGIKRFNTMFVNWVNGKATEKASTLPTVKDIANACKSIYKDCEPFGFFPIVKTNSDGAIIIDCVKWVEGFYSEKKASDKASEKKSKKIEIDFDDLVTMLKESNDIEMLCELRDIINNTIDSKVTLHKAKKSA